MHLLKTLVGVCALTAGSQACITGTFQILPGEDIGFNGWLDDNNQFVCKIQLPELVDESTPMECMRENYKATLVKGPLDADWKVEFSSPGVQNGVIRLKNYGSNSRTPTGASVVVFGVNEWC